MQKAEEADRSSRKRFEFPGVRYLFAASGFLGFCVIYSIRVNINVAIVTMVNNTAVYDKHNETTSGECKDTNIPFNLNGTSYESPQDGEFIWSPKMQGVILGSFYYGYCISQIPGGRLAEKYSGKWVFGIGTVITALLTLLTPLAARWHVGLLIAVRSLEGLAQGMTMPAMHSMLGRWLPDTEKNILSTVVYTGINIGTVAAMPLAGALCNSTWFGGWPSAFYVIGLFGCFWFILWCICVTDTPMTHPFISKKELKYITSNQKIELNKQLPPMPWSRIATSIPFLALVITQIGQDWCFYTILNDLPTFFATVLHFKVEKNGFLASFPYLLQTAVGLIVGFVADELIRRGCATTNCVRKFCNTVSGFGTAAGLVAVILSGCDVTLNVVFFMFSMAIGGFCYSGYMLSALDLSPEYAGTLMGIANTVSNLTGFIVPLIVGTLTDQQQTLHQWRYVFGITVLVLSTTSLVFLFFSSSKKQDWAETSSPSTSMLITDKEQSINPSTYGTI
ncbi:sialin-like [Argiope bruennichi]|uniref:sialin-like n=1 Tax=Argiope bruennichi TaxID=94029 RepID=UPI002494DDB6|nr:sialin-like [Argiope bruennichi]XP_055942794.1 sialin-like [Argiope bruennichi]